MTHLGTGLHYVYTGQVKQGAEGVPEPVHRDRRDGHIKLVLSGLFHTFQILSAVMQFLSILITYRIRNQMAMDMVFLCEIGLDL